MPMLIRSQINTLRVHWARSSLFALLPSEIMQQIISSPIPDNTFIDALDDAAFGRKEALIKKLNQARAKNNLKQLLLQAGDVITPAGKLVKNTTILGCLIGGGDFELVQDIICYYRDFECGEEELKSQLEWYRPCIEELTTQQPDYDITWLIEIIINSSQEDVTAELAEEDEFDPAYKSTLRDAMNKFRNEMLDPKRRIIKSPTMHCNYKNFNHIDEVYDREWHKLREGDNYNKHRLISRQIFGFMQLIELTAYERYVYAQADSAAAIAGQPIKRSFDFCHPCSRVETFRVFSADSLLHHSGIGYDSWASIFGYDSKSMLGPPRNTSSYFNQLWEAKEKWYKKLYNAALTATTTPSFRR